MKKLSIFAAVCATALATPALAANVENITSAGINDPGGGAPTATVNYSSTSNGNFSIDSAATGANFGLGSDATGDLLDIAAGAAGEATG